MEIFNPKIEKYINELSDEYKELLFQRLIEESESIDDISISELLKIDNDVKDFLKNRREKTKLKRIQLLGVTYAALGMILFLFAQIMVAFHDNSRLSIENLVELISIIIACTGIMISFFPIMYGTIIHRKKGNNTESIRIREYKVITLWRELEGLCNDMTERQRILSNFSIIQFLLQSKLIDNEQAFELKSFLRLRNSIIHESDITKKYSTKQIDLMIKSTEKILNSIRKKIVV